MQVQRLENIDGSRYSYTIIDENFIPVPYAEQFLVWLEATGKSPLTVRSYAFQLAKFLLFLTAKRIAWNEVKTADLADYLRYLQTSTAQSISTSSENIILFPNDAQESKRSAKTINLMMTVVFAFYQFHARLENVPNLNIFDESGSRFRSYKPFLHHISKKYSVSKNSFKLKTSKNLPKVVENEDFIRLINACTRIRDKFLLYLLFESGLRIGQALGLRHSDINLPDSEIKIVPRPDNVNFVRAKTRDEYIVHVNQNLMSLYTDYLLEEFEDIESDYVFVNLWSKPIGRPMRYSAVYDIFRRLKAKTGINIHPHMLRHTHATNFIRASGRMDIAQRRLGHKSIQTTQSIYTHISNEDLKREYKEYQEKINKK